MPDAPDPTARLRTYWPLNRLNTVRLIFAVLALALLAGLFTFDSPWKVGFDKLNVRGEAKLEDFINAGEWFACLFNAVLCICLGATAQWWLGPPPCAPTQARPFRQRLTSWRGWWVVAIVVLGALIIPAVLPEGGPAAVETVVTGPGEVMQVLNNVTPGFGFIAACVVLALAGAAAWILLPLGDGLDASRKWIPVFYLLLFMIVGIAGWMRAPRLDHSLWNDEEYTLRKYSWGEMREKEDGTFKLRRVKWAETFFFNRGANNHIPHSITSRLSLAAWTKFFKDDADPRFFSEHAYRLPGFLAGLLGLCVVALLLRNMGLAPVGITAAALLTLHPWHLRYSVEARGYSWMLLFILLAIYCLHRAMRGSADDAASRETGAPSTGSLGRWPWWLGYGLFQFLYMWSFPGALYVAVALNGAAFAWITWVHRASLLKSLATPLPRLIIANVLSVMCFVQMMGPSIPQIRLYLQREISQGEMNADWWRDIAAHAVTGMQWAQEVVKPPASANFIFLARTYTEQGMLVALVWVLLGIAFLAGVVSLLRRAPLAAILTVAPVFAAVLAYAHMQLSGNFLYSWYLLYAIPSLCMAAAAFPLVASWFSRKPGPTQGAAMATISLLLIGSFAALNQTPLFTMRHVDRQPLRAMSAANRAALLINVMPEAAASTSVAVFGVSAEQFRSYAPELHVLNEEKELEDFLCESFQNQQVPIVYVSGPARAAREDTEVFDALNAALAQYEEVTLTSTGIEDMFTLRGYALKLDPRMCGSATPPAP